MIKFYGERYIFFRLININIKVSWRMFFEAMEAIARVFERHQEFYPIVQGSFSSAPRRRRSWLLSWPVPRVVSDVYTCTSAWLLLTRSSFIPSTTLTTCAIELLSTRFVHSPFALESKLQRGDLSLFPREITRNLEPFNKYLPSRSYTRKRMFQFRKWNVKLLCLSWIFR